MKQDLVGVASSPDLASKYLSERQYIVLVGYTGLPPELITEISSQYGFEKSAVRLFTDFPKEEKLLILEDSNCVGIFIAGNLVIDSDKNLLIQDKMYTANNVNELENLHQNFKTLFDFFKEECKSFDENFDSMVIQKAA